MDRFFADCLVLTFIPASPEIILGLPASSSFSLFQKSCLFWLLLGCLINHPGFQLLTLCNAKKFRYNREKLFHAANFCARILFLFSVLLTFLFLGFSEDVDTPWNDLTSSFAFLKPFVLFICPWLLLLD